MYARISGTGSPLVVCVTMLVEPLTPRQAHALQLQRTDYQPRWARALQRQSVTRRLYDGAADRLTTNGRRRELALMYLGEWLLEARLLLEALPKTSGPLRLLDIGCGLGGLDVVISTARDTRLILLDRDEFARNPHYGFQPEGAAYNSLAETAGFLTAQGVPREHVRTVNIAAEPFPQDEQDAVISSISWGFHYPVGTYLDEVHKVLAPGGVTILDVRKGTDGIDELRGRFEEVAIIADGVKHHRVRATKS